MKSSSRVWLFATPWTVAYKAPLSMEFSRQEYWSGLPFPYPGDLPEPGIEPRSPSLQADTLPSEPPGKYVALHWLISYVEPTLYSWGKSTWSWCIIHFVWYWIQQHFVENFCFYIQQNIGFLLLSLSRFGIRVTWSHRMSWKVISPLLFFGKNWCYSLNIW